MAFFICILCICSLAGVLSAFSKRKIDFTIPLGISLIIVILYICGLLNILIYGFYFILIASFISLGILIFYLIKDKTLKKKILTPGALIFIIFILYILYKTKGCVLSDWDDFSQWGIVIKQMFLQDKISIFFGSDIRFPEYPPATALFQYFFEKVSHLLGGDFNDTILLRAMNLQILACFLPVFNKLEWRSLAGKKMPFSIKRIVLMIFVPIVSLIILPMYYNSSIYYSLGVDGILGVYFAYILFQYFCERQLTSFTFVSLAVTCFVVPLIKSAGTAIAGMAIIIIVIDLFSFNRKELKEFLGIGESRRKIIYGLLIVTSVPIILALSKFSWSIACSAAGIGEKYSVSSITLQGLIKLIHGNGQQYQYTSLASFITAYKSTFVLITAQIVMAFGFMLSYSKTRHSKKRWSTFIILLFVFNILYAIGQELLYLYVFAPVEAINLASYDRYISIILIGTSLILIFLLFDRFIFDINKEAEKTLPIIAFTIIFSFMAYFMPLKKNSIFFANSYAAQTVSQREPLDYQKKIAAQLDKDKDRVFYISEHSKGYDYWVTCYNLLPIKCSPAFSWNIGNSSGTDSSYNDDMYMRKLSVDEWEKEIISGRYTYVILQNVDTEFINTYAVLFEDPQTIVSKSLYRVKIVNDHVKLINIPLG